MRYGCADVAAEEWYRGRDVWWYCAWAPEASGGPEGDGEYGGVPGLPSATRESWCVEGPACGCRRGSIGVDIARRGCRLGRAVAAAIIAAGEDCVCGRGGDELRRFAFSAERRRAERLPTRALQNMPSGTAATPTSGKSSTV